MNFAPRAMLGSSGDTPPGLTADARGIQNGRGGATTRPGEGRTSPPTNFGRARRTRPGKGRCFPYLSTGPYHQLCGT